jgi:dipeptidyl aminopeptidase/acylaminoacyl peptidase
VKRADIPLRLAIASCFLLGWSGCPGDPAVTRKEVRAALGIPQFRNPLEARLVSRWKKRDTVIESVRFQGRRGDFIPALVCYSELARHRPAPAILCMPGSPNRKEDLMQPLQLLPRWARRGFFVLSIDRPYHGERGGDSGAAIRRKGLVKVWGEYVHDLMRAVDYIGTRPEAARGRVGMLGLSMGGMEALLISALDPRVGVVVSVAGQLSWEEIFASGSWRVVFPGLPLARELRRSAASNAAALEAFRSRYPGLETIDASRISQLLAPRPLLLMTGAEDPFVPPPSTRRTYEEAVPFYESAGAADRIALWIEPDTGHAFSKPMEERSLQWFARWLESGS